MYTPRRRAKKAKEAGPFRRIRLFIALCLVVFAGLGFGYIFAAYQSLPTVSNSMRPAVSSQVFDAHGRLITTLHSDQNRLPIDINKVPQNLQNAFIAAEDNRFYQHIGIDPIGIVRALFTNLTNRGIAQGGSTITQQLAKNAFLSQEQTMKRKIQEAMLALEIEQKYSKKEILEMYMNQIYFGQGAYGVETAANTYFGKHVEDLDLAEAAMIAGIPKSPNYYNPKANPKAAKARQETVLSQMEKYNFITPEEHKKASEEKLEYKSLTSNPGSKSYFIDYCIQILIDKFGPDAVYKQGLKVYTSLDPTMQKAAERAAALTPTYYTDNNKLKQPQSAIVAIDPKTGYIKAMIGGRGTDQFNRAVMAERQPGSAFKPFVYLNALEHGATPNDIVDDSPIPGSWNPQNYDRRFHGKMTYRRALTYSYNIPAIKISEKYGNSNVLKLAKKMGITTLVEDGPQSDDNSAMALGGLTHGVTPLEMASAYGTFANKGVHVKPTAIIKILDRNGNVLEDESTLEKEENKTRVMSEKEAHEMTVMLEGVIDYGTGTAASLGRPAAGKTGTTDDNKDAWFVGYTPDIVTAVWIGDDTGSHSLGEVYGGTIPAEIWKDYMSSAASDEHDREFAVPAGMERVRARAALSNNSARVADDAKKSSDTEKKDSDDKEKTDEKAESRSEETSRQPSEEARRQQEDSNNKAQ